VPPPDVWIAAPDDATRAIPAVQPPADPRTAAPTVIAKPAFLAGSAIREAATARGLELDEGVFANIAAALSGGQHVLLVGPPGSGKTELALAVTEAATAAGKASGATLIAGAPEQDHVLDAARTGRWLVLEDLEAMPISSAFLGRHTVTIAGKEVAAPDSWRVVGTATKAPSTLSRFAAIDVDHHPDLAAAIAHTTQDTTATAAVKRLLPLRDLQPLGAGLFLAAAAHAAARRAEQPADELTLAREVYAAYIQPLMGDKDAEAKEIVG
jgi:energy-coupling factor transporter ATP-binding protein EcfA2